MGKFTRFLAWAVGISAVVVLILRVTLFESWVIPEDKPWLAASIAPTLGPGDSVLVLTRGTPGFGDLVRCHDPEDPTGWIIGRIVGLPRDTVEVASGTLTVNGARYDTTEACAEPQFSVEHPDTGSPIELRCGRVEMAGGWHFIGMSTKQSKTDDKKAQVGEGEVFLLSDNLSLHDDSRDFGLVPLESCEGRIVFRLWSRDGWGDSKNRFDLIR